MLLDKPSDDRPLPGWTQVSFFSQYGNPRVDEVSFMKEFRLQSKTFPERVINRPITIAKKLCCLKSE